MGCPQHMNLFRLWLVLLVAALPLLGAAELGLAAPVVVVYPLTATGDTGSADTGSSVGVAIANKLVELGGITVKPYLAGTTRAQYLTAAVTQNADYYITGYITPLGSEVSVVEQVVSTRSGSIVYSTTAFARTYADAVGPADLLRQAILHHAGRGMASLDAPPPSASPEPIAGKNGVNISKAFGRRRKATPAPAASAAPAVAGPASAATPTHVALAGTGSADLVISTAGTADATVRAYASQSLVSALRRSGRPSAFLPVSVADIGAHAADLCRANAGAGFYVPTLGIEVSKNGANVTLDVVGYDCKAMLLATGRSTGSAKAVTRTAVQGAVDAATADFVKRLARPRRAATRAIPPAGT